MFRISLIVVGLALAPFSAWADMDCDEMFKDSESKISSKGNLEASEKVKLYEMAVDAYKKCKQGEEDEAEDLFNKVFDGSDRM